MCMHTLVHQLGIYKEHNYEDRSVGLKTYRGSGVGCGVVHRLFAFWMRRILVLSLRLHIVNRNLTVGWGRCPAPLEIPLLHV
jgi:hypothetical protein